MNLNLKKASSFYTVIRPFVPENYKELSYLALSSAIIENIRNRNKLAFFDVFRFMYDVDQESIMAETPETVLVLFTKALHDFHLKELISFVEGLQ